MSELLHTAITVSDLESMRAFYQETLELKHSREIEIDGRVNCFISGESAAEIQLAHEPDSDFQTEQTGFGHLAVGVDDVDATVERARERWDSEIEHEPETIKDLDVRIAFIVDPEGYSVELIEEM